jgi:hypothetical protein
MGTLISQKISYTDVHGRPLLANCELVTVIKNFLLTAQVSFPLCFVFLFRHETLVFFAGILSWCKFLCLLGGDLLLAILTVGVFFADMMLLVVTPGSVSLCSAI